jgi:hypothetical protein
MESPPSRCQCLAVAVDETKNAPGVTFIATDNFSYLRAGQVDDHYPTGAEHVDMSGRMIVGIDRDP